MNCASRWQPCNTTVGSVFGAYAKQFELRYTQGYANPTTKNCVLTFQYTSRCCNFRDCGHGCRVLSELHMAMSSMSPNPVCPKRWTPQIIGLSAHLRIGLTRAVGRTVTSHNCQQWLRRQGMGRFKFCKLRNTGPHDILSAPHDYRVGRNSL